MPRKKSQSTASGSNGWSDIKHFKPADFACTCPGLCNHMSKMDMGLVGILDKLREEVGQPFRILKGTRCAQQNNLSRGAPNSPHVPDKNGVSRAVDVRVPNAGFRFQILLGALKLGFNRVGVGRDWVHLEIAPGEKEPRLWTYRPNRRQK